MTLKCLNKLWLFTEDVIYPVLQWTLVLLYQEKQNMKRKQTLLIVAILLPDMQ